MHGVVEGEPGIFPDPVARLMRTIGRWYGRRRPGSSHRAADEPSDRSSPDVPGERATDAADERSADERSAQGEAGE